MPSIEMNVKENSSIQFFFKYFEKKMILLDDNLRCHRKLTCCLNILLLQILVFEFL